MKKYGIQTNHSLGGLEPSTLRFEARCSTTTPPANWQVERLNCLIIISKCWFWFSFALYRLEYLYSLHHIFFLNPFGGAFLHYVQKKLFCSAKKYQHEYFDFLQWFHSNPHFGAFRTKTFLTCLSCCRFIINFLNVVYDLVGRGHRCGFSRRCDQHLTRFLLS